MIKAIFVDAGHGLGPTGAIDNGAVGSGTTERAEVVEIARELLALLSADADLHGVRLIEIGVEDRMMLKDKIAEVNSWCGREGWTSATTLLVSIHLNSAASPEARGLEAWYSKNKSGALQFAKALIEQLAASTGLPLRPTSLNTSDTNRLGRLGILDDTIPQGCLVECGFVSNEFDARVFKDATIDDRFAQGILRGIRTFLSLPPTAAMWPSNMFRDVAETAWYHGDVKLCLQEKIFRMPVDGLFHPERPVTRAELATVIARHLHHHHGLR